MKTKSLRLITLFCLLAFYPAFFSKAQVSPKRGMAYGYHSVADIDAVSAGVSWWYNWASVPDNDIAGYYESIGVEYVPMVWGGTFDVNTVINNIRPDAKYLLAFNEPNFNVESNLTPAQAVALWPQIEQIAAAKNLEIVSASAAYCGGGVCVPGYTDPTVWHTEFFNLCPTCKVDYIAFHVYEETVGGATYLTDQLKQFGRPIWVTEFARWNTGVSNADKVPYLQQLVEAYENDPDIYRYAWFTGRRADNTTVNLLEQNTSGALTALGTAYINAAYGPQTTIPGKVEAESHYRRRGTDMEGTTDVGGGQNVGWTDAGTWVEYIIDVNTGGSYTFNFRVASNVSTGTFNILIDDQVVRSNINVATTGGWQTWADLPVTGIALTSGEHLVKLQFTNTGTNLNYFNVNYEGNIVADANFSASPLNTCVGNTVTFTDQTSNKTGGETYAWNFGADATPATANTAGPHAVTYSTSGNKTVTLTVTNSAGPDTETKTDYVSIGLPPSTCIFADDFEDNSVDWVTPVPGAFTHTETGSLWTINNGGYGEWENFLYEINDGNTASAIDFSCSSNKPILKIKARASANALLRVSLRDGTGKVIDNYANTDLELTTSFQTFTINYEGRFRNYYGATPGILDSTNITELFFAINPGFASYPITGSNGTYNAYFPGTVEIEWIGIGNNCDVPTLPVELTNFEGEALTNSIHLTWTTLSENNNDFFAVERSTDGSNFTQIGVVDGSGNSTSAINYSFDDPSTFTTVVYYRLRQVDLNGSFQYSEVISIDPGSPPVTGLLNIYSNPSDGNDYIIEWKGNPKECELQIYNLLGEMIYSKQLTPGDNKIKPNELPQALGKGIYILKIAGLETASKLVIE